MTKTAIFWCAIATAILWACGYWGAQSYFKWESGRAGPAAKITHTVKRDGRMISGSDVDRGAYQGAGHQKLCEGLDPVNALQKTLCWMLIASVGLFLSGLGGMAYALKNIRAKDWIGDAALIATGLGVGAVGWCGIVFLLTRH